jgi:hypothetical protein
MINNYISKGEGGGKDAINTKGMMHVILKAHPHRKVPGHLSQGLAHLDLNGIRPPKDYDFVKKLSCKSELVWLSGS